MGAMLDLAPSSLAQQALALYRGTHWRDSFSGRRPKAELAMTVDFHLDRCSSPLFKASPACRLSRQYIHVTQYHYMEDTVTSERPCVQFSR